MNCQMPRAPTRDIACGRNRQHHRAIAAGSGISTLKDAASAIGEVGNEAGDLVGHHQRQIGARVLDVGFGLGFGAGIGGRSEAVSLVDGSRLGFLLLLLRLLGVGGRSAGIKIVHALNDAVEFFFEAGIGSDVKTAAQQGVEGGVEILLGVVRLAGMIVGESGLIFLFGPGNQLGNRVIQADELRGSSAHGQILNRRVLYLGSRKLGRLCRNRSTFRSLQGRHLARRKHGGGLLCAMAPARSRDQGYEQSGAEIIH